MKYFFVLFSFLILFFGCERPTDIQQGDDGIPPGVPDGLRFYYSSDGEIIIEWRPNGELDVKGYNIYRRTENTDYSLIGFSSSDYYFDDSLYYDTLYFYRISAVDNAGLESSFTNEISSRPVNRYTPDTPRNFQINGRNWMNVKSVYISWERVDESDVAGYKIYRDTSSGFSADTASYIGFSTVPEFEDTSANETYVEYFYKVKAVDKGLLVSNVSITVSDIIFTPPLLLYPAENSSVSGFRQFIFTGAGAPASYKLIVQSNQFFGEIWQADVTSSVPFDTIKVNVPSGIFYYNTNYYWRVAAFSKSSQPNSFSNLNKFSIRP